GMTALRGFRHFINHRRPSTAAPKKPPKSRSLRLTPEDPATAAKEPPCPEFAVRRNDYRTLRKYCSGKNGSRKRILERCALRAPLGLAAVDAHIRSEGKQETSRKKGKLRKILNYRETTFRKQFAELDAHN